jgi:asparagine synthase (glutamine-hydrolysing)
MCGIFGAITTRESFDPGSFERFTELTDSVRYRGPDASDYLALDTRNRRVSREEPFNLFLGHRRLSILDLSPAGRQPMYDGQGCWIAFNGEIFNFVELRRELEEKGYRFTTGTDTEVILHVYSEYGEQGFEKLNGMWALALVDLPRNRVVLSRDRFSIKPLYLVQQPHCLFFASEIKQLLPLLSRKELNSQVMSTFLVQGLTDFSRETFFRGVTRVPPKTNVVIQLSDLSMEENTYWEYDRGEPVPVEQAVQQFRDLLEDSVRIRLRSDVKVGVLLSGGLDSSSIAVVADQLTGGQMEMYSVVSEDPRYSEERFVTCLSRTRALKSHRVMFRPLDVAETLATALHSNDEPFGTLSVLAQYKLFESIKQATDVTVLLSGQGGDEILLGYLKFFVFYLRQLVREHSYGTALIQVLASIIRRTAVFQLSIPNARRYLPFLNDFRALIKGPYSFVPIGQSADLRERQIADIDKYSIPVLARYEDRNSMAHSLEVRHPFLDHRLINLCLNLRPDQKIKSGWTKYILREGFPELPECIRWRRDKQGFTTPEKHWLSQELSPMLRANFKGSWLSQMGILDDHEFLRYYETFQRGGPVPFNDISRPLIAEVWCRQHF